MIEALNPYPKYAESNLPWIGAYPEHWQLRRTKVLFQERVQKGFPDEPLLAATQTQGVVRKTDYASRTVTAQKDLHLLKLVEVGDYVISLRSFEGGIEVAHYRGIISPAYTVLRYKYGRPSGYFSHFFKSKQFISSLSLFVTGIREGQNIDYPRLSRVELPLPPINEQESIVQFLHAANLKLNKFILSKRKLIASLNEEKQVIIQRSVTRGLATEATLKPSGIPWVGDVPGHWEILRAKYVFKEVDERSESGTEELLSVSHLTGVTRRSEKNITMFKAVSYAGHKLCRPGDLAINTMWAWMGALGVANEVGIISPAYAVYRLHKEQRMLGAYVELLLRTRAYTSNFMCRSTGVRASRLRLYPEEFFKMPILVPPLTEQLEIVEFISGETASLNNAIARTEREIGLIQEYRTRLTADIVTGKLDVREAASKLPELSSEVDFADEHGMLDDENLSPEIEDSDE